MLKRNQSLGHTVQPPRQLEPGESWDYEADVIVIGFGGAGAAAALEAHSQGKKVIIVERFNGGGATKISGGVVYAGGGTSLQESLGIDDSPKEMYRYLQQEVQGVVSDDVLQAFCDESSENFNWLKQQGVEFNGSMCPEKTSYPSNRHYFYYSGNESFEPYSSKAKPAPRGHRAFGKGVSGRALFKPLQRAVLHRGIQLIQQGRACGLIVDKGKRVIGVEFCRINPRGFGRWLHLGLYQTLISLRYVAIFVPWLTRLLEACLGACERRWSERQLAKASQGVILATGGFIYNRKMVEHYAPRYLKGMPLGTVGDQGEGIALGQTVGGSLKHMHRVSAWRFFNPPLAFGHGLLVGSDGRRICNEMLYGEKIGDQIQRLQDGQGYLIIDYGVWQRALSQLKPGASQWFQIMAGLLYLFVERYKAASIDDLAQKIGAHPANLRETVETYNGRIRDGKDDPLGKPSKYQSLVAQAPFYALKMSFDSKWVPCPTLTLGGLRVDDAGRVLDGAKQPVAGLYAVGRSAVGVSSQGYVSGLSIADCIFSGRRAGRHASMVSR